MIKAILWLIFFNFSLLPYCFGALQYEFYKGKCGSFGVEDIVHDVVSKRCQNDPTTSAALLHMLFHDCFVNVRTKIYPRLHILHFFSVFVDDQTCTYSFVVSYNKSTQLVSSTYICLVQQYGISLKYMSSIFQFLGP